LFTVVGPLQPALLAEQKIIYFANQFEHPLRVLLDGGLFAEFSPTFRLSFIAAPDIRIAVGMGEPARYHVDAVSGNQRRPALRSALLLIDIPVSGTKSVARRLRLLDRSRISPPFPLHPRAASCRRRYSGRASYGFSSRRSSTPCSQGRQSRSD
jgi:hypothetical protein